MEGGAAVDARTFQTEALKIEKLLYHISYAMLRNESDCEDAVQEALLRAWQKRGTLRDMAAFRSWLWPDCGEQPARNCCGGSSVRR